MTELTKLYIELGFNDAETYIQSGNVIFSSDDKITVPSLAANIEKGILERFSFIIPVMIRTNNDLGALFSSNPFLNEINFDPSKMAVLFLHDKPTEAQIQKVAGIDYPPDRFKIVGTDIFIYCPNGFGRTKLYTNFFENKMKVKGTARNWKTITTILQIAGNKI
jgi:uncharacterized protein (DUF1697 family)